MLSHDLFLCSPPPPFRHPDVLSKLPCALPGEGEASSNYSFPFAAWRFDSAHFCFVLLLNQNCIGLVFIVEYIFIVLQT